MCAQLCAHVCVCARICMLAHELTYVYALADVFAYANTNVDEYYAYTNEPAQANTHVYLYDMYARMCAHMQMRMHTARVCIRLYVCVCVRVCAFGCVAVSYFAGIGSQPRLPGASCASGQDEGECVVAASCCCERSQWQAPAEKQCGSSTSPGVTHLFGSPSLAGA